MTAAPLLKRPIYHVWLERDGAEPDYHRVVVNGTDQLRAELEGRKLGLVKLEQAPMHLTALWLWASLTRTGSIDLAFPAFRDALLSFDPAKDDDGELADEPVDPTAASTS